MIGTLIGHIRVTGVLGEGGMGEVYRGVDERLGRDVAIKAIHGERRMSPDARARFLREARLLSSLDHPNICRIHEYVETTDGDYLVLELLEGVTLERAIEQGLGRARKLRIALEVCDALAAAHRKGIIHRDLKAANVMVAANGTAKILDFGVARTLETEDSAQSNAEEPIEKARTLIFPIRPDGSSPSRPQHVATEHGIAVGTPAYMSPEQAQGKTVTPASDMYSFGLLLQYLFTEKDPQPEFINAPAMMARAAAGISEPMTGQPRDITALVERLKRLAPADRPTAMETLGILGRIIDTPKRRLRVAMLAALLVFLAAFATKYVFDVTAARRDAERRRGQAEELVSFMIGDLRTKLEAVGRLEVLDDAASRALAYFASLAPGDLRDEDLHKNALALAQLGEVRMKEGKLDAAAALFEQSIRFASEAVARDPARDDWQLALSNAHFWAGEAARRKDDPAGMLTHFRSYLQISELLAARHPGEEKYEAEVSYGHANEGMAHEAAGDLRRALAEYRFSVDVNRRRLQRSPTSETCLNDLAKSLNRVAVAQQNLGELRAARAAFADELALRRRLLALAPDDARSMSRLAVSLGWNGSIQYLMGDAAAALASWREELGIASTLSGRDPKNLDTRRHRWVAQSRIAMATPGLDAAFALIDEATRELEETVRIDPHPARRADLAAALNTKARIALARNDVSTALASARASLGIVSPLAVSDPGPNVTRIFGEALLQAANAEERSGNAEAARRHRQRLADMTSGEQDGDPRLVALRMRALTALGRGAEAAPLAARLDAAGFRDLPR